MIPFKHNLPAIVKGDKSLNKKLLMEIASYILILLFLYAGISKLTIYHEFQIQMTQSPLLPRSFIPLLAWFIPLFELLIAWLLVFDRTKLTGFYLSFVTMFIFTLYLIVLISVAENAPCSCGGILGSMGYTEHIIFNCVFTLIALYGCLKMPSINKAVKSS